MSDLAALAIWWLCLQAVGLAALPLTLRLFKELPDRGWHFAGPSGLPSEIGFNLMVATVFGLAATGAYSLGANLAQTRRPMAGLLAVALVMFLGNLEPTLEVLNAHALLPDSVRTYAAIRELPPAS